MGGMKSILVGAPPFMKRWHLIPRNPFFNVYLHNIFGADIQTPHDHPWFNLTIVLKGAYCERANGRTEIREAGDFKFRSPWFAHRIWVKREPCWTLFITGPRIRKWGFLTRDGWIKSSEFKTGKFGDI